MTDAPGDVDANLADPNLADPNLANDEVANNGVGFGDDDDDDADDDADANELPGARATDVLEYLVKELVDEPDAVEIDVDDGRRGLRMRVSVAPGDMGRVIGRRGRIANAIRTVVRAAAVDDGIAVDVEFVD